MSSKFRVRASLNRCTFPYVTSKYWKNCNRLSLVCTIDLKSCFDKTRLDWNSNQIIRFRTISSGMRDTLMRETHRMTMNMGYCYRCRNPGCSCEIEVTRPSKEAARDPRCCCGAEMRRPYAKPILKELELDAHPAAFSGISEKEETTRTR